MDLVAALPQEPEYGEHDAFVSGLVRRAGHNDGEDRKTLDDARIPFRVIEYKDTALSTCQLSRALRNCGASQSNQPLDESEAETTAAMERFRWKNRS